MRATHRQILASLTFLVPLGLLAWVGGQELRRQGERAQNALSDQAIDFLSIAASTIEPFVEQFVTEVLDNQLDLANRLPLEAIRELSEPDTGPILVPQLRDIFLLDEDGQLIFPYPPPEDQGLAFHGTPAPPELNAAEYLESSGHLEEARQILERFLEPIRLRWREDSLRAAMGLARIYRKLGLAAEAAQVYEDVLDDLELAWDFDSEDVDWEIVSILHLQASVGLAEVQSDAAARPEIMRLISEGSYDDVADPALAAVMERLLDGIPDGDSALLADALSARKTDRIRTDGRTFAASYELFLAETLRRRAERSGEADHLFHAFADDDGSWLLSFRRATPEERDRQECEWVGIRLDLAFLLNEEVAPFLRSDARGFTLAILDSTGEPVLPAGELEEDFELDLVRNTSVGMQLRPIPADPEAFMAADQASVRNRAMLIGFLVLVAGGGAFFLWRSVHRESELAQLKVDLVSRVSHELKTPLSLIRLYGETLGMGRTRDQEQVSHFASVITRESERLSHMIGRILDFSRQEAGTLHYQKKPVELAGVVTAVIDAYRAHVEASGASLHIDLTDGLVSNVDSDALEAAVLNLLENAVKYTPTDAPDRGIHLELRRDDHRAIIEIKDRGMGVPNGEHHRVFDSFYRASNAGEARGAGLGLSLVRHFAEAHGGTIEIIAREGGGTTAQLALPTYENGERHGETN